MKTSSDHHCPTRLESAIAEMQAGAFPPATEKPPIRYGQMRLCFTQGKLTDIVLLREDGSCNTPPCDYTSLELPQRAEDMSKLKIGLGYMDYFRMCREAS